MNEKTLAYFIFGAANTLTKNSMSVNSENLLSLIAVEMH